jgi:hypothetical protein
MNYQRMALAAVIATVVDLVYGFLIYGWLIADAYNPYPGVYRSGVAVRSYMPLGFAGIFIAILVLAVIYAKGYEGGHGAVEGTRFGVLAGIFVVCELVGTNYVTLNIGGKLALEQAAVALVEWTILGIVIGLIYKPAAADVR